MRLIILVTSSLVILLSTRVSEATLRKGVVAPSFPALEEGRQEPMTILYFFKLSSKSSIKGLEHLKIEYPRYKEAGIAVYAISKDDPKVLAFYLKDHFMPFPVIRDDGKIFRDYKVQLVLPTTYVLSPGGRISDIIEGGGLTSRQFITAIAQRSLQLKKPDLAKTIYAEVLRKNPDDLSAQTGLGHALIMDGRIDRAEAVFNKVVKLSPPNATLGQEGLAVIHLKKGEHDKALNIAKEINKTESENGLAHLIKGNILSSQGDQDEALKEYNRAIDGKLSSDGQRADAYNKAGLIYVEREEYLEAESMYDQAVNQNPFSSEILTNRGALYEKQGKPLEALALYEEASVANPGDREAVLLSLLSEQIEKNLNIVKAKENQEKVLQYIDDELEKLPIGNISFNTPIKMNINESALVHLVLSLKKSLNDLNKLVEGKGKIEEARVRVAATMEAHLTGQDFDIQEITRETQPISLNEINPWKWEIRPKRKGLQTLRLTLSALLTVDGESTYKSIRVFERVIEVQVTPFQTSKDFLQGNWQWLLATIIIPLAGWGLKKNKSTT